MYDVKVTEDLSYADVDGQRLLADLYRPATEQPPPVVLYVHGGGFARGSRSDNAEDRLAALAAHGVAVLSLDYRLVHAVRFHMLHEALVRAGAQSSPLLLGGAGHEDAAFDAPANLALTAGFLSAALRAA
jgi:acetyl esterase/lipase